MPILWEDISYKPAGRADQQRGESTMLFDAQVSTTRTVTPFRVILAIVGIVGIVVWIIRLAAG